MANPVLNEKTFANNGENIYVSSNDIMTVNGTIGKSALLLIITLVGGAFSWYNFSTGNIPLSNMMAAIGIIAGIILSFVIAFKPKTAPMLAPIYAICEGLALGTISAMYNATYDGIISQAILGTFATLFTVLALYSSRIITLTEKVRSIIFIATLATCISYFALTILSIFHVPLPQITNTVSIAVSLVVIVIAAINFLLDFDNIERGVQAYAPKYFEWYCGFGLLVTVVWLYLEILKLLAKLNRK